MAKTKAQGAANRGWFKSFDPFTASYDDLVRALDKRMARLPSRAKVDYKARLDYIAANRSSGDYYKRLNVEGMIKTILADPKSTREGYAAYERNVEQPVRSAVEWAGVDPDEAREIAHEIVRNTDIFDTLYFKHGQSEETEAAREAKVRLDEGTPTEEDVEILRDYVKNFRALKRAYDRKHLAEQIRYRREHPHRAHNTRRK